MVEIMIRNPSDTDKIITIVRNPVKYTIPANEEIIITLENPEKDIILLES